MIFKKYSAGTIAKNKNFKWQGWIETKCGAVVAFVDTEGSLIFDWQNKYEPDLHGTSK